MVSVGTSIVPPGPCPPYADTPGTSPAVTTPQVTASIHDFAGSLHRTRGHAGSSRRPFGSAELWAKGQPPSEPDGPAFRASGSPAIYAACATGFAWIQSWQAAQTMSVLRRIFAMRAAHTGWPGPGAPSSLRPATWWTATVVPVSQSSHSRLRSRDSSSVRGTRTGTGAGSRDDRPPVLPQDDPAEPCYQIRLALRLRLASKQVLGPSPVIDLRLVAGGHLGDGGLVLGGQGLQHRRLGVPAQRAQPPDVLGEQGRVGCPARSGIRRYRPFPDSLPPNSACPLSRH